MKHLLVIYLLSIGTALSGGLLFSQMEAGDKIQLTEKSTGCFHDTTSYYEVRRSEEAWTFSEYAIVWDKVKRGKIREKNLVGELELTAKDISGLDGLLRFYRGKKKASSTTQVSLSVEFYEDGKLIKLERLTDGSGGYGLRERKDIVRFYELVRRIEKLQGE
jgi:hypothetical protein